jgi:D-3-phosphoglycerate dehydrogenase
MKLVGQLGSFAGQITDEAITKVEIEYRGDVAKLNVKPLTALALANLLRPLLDTVNMVNAPQVAKSRGISVSETKTEDDTDLHTAIRLCVTTGNGTRCVMGTLFAGKEPRIVDIEGVPVEAALSPHMLYLRNEDKPGLIGGVGTILGKAKQNIADFRLGRIEKSDVAVALISLDGEAPDEVIKDIEKLPQVKKIKRLKFPE